MPEATPATDHARAAHRQAIVPTGPRAPDTDAGDLQILSNRGTPTDPLDWPANTTTSGDGTDARKGRPFCLASWPPVETVGAGQPDTRAASMG